MRVALFFLLFPLSSFAIGPNARTAQILRAQFAIDYSEIRQGSVHRQMELTIKAAQNHLKSKGVDPKSPENVLLLANTKKLQTLLALAKRMEKCRFDEGDRLADKILDGASTIDPCSMLSGDIEKIITNLDQASVALDRAVQEPKPISPEFVENTREEATLQTLHSSWILEHMFPLGRGFDCVNQPIYEKFSFKDKILEKCGEFQKELAEDVKLPESNRKFIQFAGKNPYDDAVKTLDKGVAELNKKIEDIQKFKPDYSAETRERMKSPARERLSKQYGPVFNEYQKTYKKFREGPMNALFTSATFRSVMGEMQSADTAEIEAGSLKPETHKKVSRQTVQLAISEMSAQVNKRLSELADGQDVDMTSLMAMHPYAVGAALMKDPSSVSSICSLITNRQWRQDLMKKISTTADYGLFAIGLVPGLGTIAGRTLSGVKFVAGRAIGQFFLKEATKNTLNLAAGVSGFASLGAAVNEAARTQETAEALQQLQIAALAHPEGSKYDAEVKAAIAELKSANFAAILESGLSPLNLDAFTPLLRPSMAGKIHPRNFMKVIEDVKSGRGVASEGLTPEFKQYTAQYLSEVKTPEEAVEKTVEFLTRVKEGGPIYPGGPKATGAERFSATHQLEMIQGAFGTREFREVLRLMEIKETDFLLAVLHSDIGKFADAKKLLTEASPASDELINFLRGRGSPEDAKVLREILDGNGMKGQWFLTHNSEISNDEIRRIFRENPALLGMIHELPGMHDSYKLYKAGVLDKESFANVLLGNAGHNGVANDISGNSVGFYGNVMQDFLVNKLAIEGKAAKDPALANFLTDTTWAGETKTIIVDGKPVTVTTSKYFTPTNKVGLVHLLLDRLEGGVKYGPRKFLDEIEKGPGTTVSKVHSVFFDNFTGTRDQLVAAREFIQESKKFSFNEKQTLLYMYDSGIKKLDQHRNFFKFDPPEKVGGKAPDVFTISYEVKGRKVSKTFDKDTPYDEAKKFMDQVIVDTEKVLGDPMKNFLPGKLSRPRAIPMPVNPVDSERRREQERERQRKERERIEKGSKEFSNDPNAF